MSHAATLLTEVAAILPALNEEANIEKVVKAVLPFGQPIVVDDGSFDKTAELAEKSGALVIEHIHSLGYDAALESGLFHALNAGYEFAITMDADGQHHPEALESFKTKLENGADLVVGVRDKHQRISETFFSAASSLLWGVHDPLCGMKGYRLERLREVGHFDSYKSIGTEFTLRAARAKWRIDEVPIATTDRKGNSRFGSGLRPNWKIFRAFILGIFLARN